MWYLFHLPGKECLLGEEVIRVGPEYASMHLFLFVVIFFSRFFFSIVVHLLHHKFCVVSANIFMALNEMKCTQI